MIAFFKNRREGSAGRSSNKTERNESPETQTSAEGRGEQSVEKATERQVKTLKGQFTKVGGVEKFFPKVLKSIAAGDLTGKQCEFISRNLKRLLGKDAVSQVYGERYFKMLDRNYQVFTEPDVKKRVKGLIGLLAFMTGKPGRKIVPNILERTKTDLPNENYEEIASLLANDLITIVSKDDYDFASNTLDLTQWLEEKYKGATPEAQDVSGDGEAESATAAEEEGQDGTPAEAETVPEDGGRDGQEGPAEQSEGEGGGEADTSKTAPEGEEQGEEEGPVKNEESDKDADIVAQYAQASYDVDHMFDLEDKVARSVKAVQEKGILRGLREEREDVRGLLDEMFEDDEKPSADEGWVKDFLVGTMGKMKADPDSMTGQAKHMFESKVAVVQNYITVKERAEAERARKIGDLTDLVSEGADGEGVEGALEALTTFEQQFVDEQVRLRELVGGEDHKVAEKVKQAWGYLGDRNLASYLEKKGVYKTKDTLLGKVGYSALRAMSLRTAAMATLVPLAGFGFGAVGVGVGIGLRRGIGGVMGASGGYALARRWLEKDLKKKVDGLSESKDFGEGHYERIIDLKKEYDAFILEHRANTAEQVGVGEEYEKLQNMYSEAVKHFCGDAGKAEALRMKQSLGEVKARNAVKKKKNRAVLFGSAALGGVVSAVAMPKVFEMAQDWGANLFGADTDIDGSDRDSGKKTPQDTATTKKPDAAPQREQGNQDAAPTEAVDSPTEGEDPKSGETGDANKEQTSTENAEQPEPYVHKGPNTPEEAGLDLEKTTPTEDANADPTKKEEAASPNQEETESKTPKEAGADPKETPPTEDADADPTEMEEESSTENAREFELIDGSYTVQEGDTLSEILLAANGGDEGQMLSVIEELEKLQGQGTEEGKAQLAAFGIESGDIDLIHPNDEIKVAEIQDWLTEKDAQVNVDAGGGEQPTEQPAQLAPETQESIGQNEGFAYDRENKMLTINDAGKFSRDNLEILLGVKNPRLPGLSLPVTEDFQDFLANGVFEDGDQIFFDEDEGVIRLLDAKGEMADEIQVFESAGPDEVPQSKAETPVESGVEEGIHQYSIPKNGTILKALEGAGFNGNINNGEFMFGDGKVWKPCLVKISEPDAVWEIGSGERGEGFVEYQNILNKQWDGGNVTVTETEDAWVVEMEDVDSGSMDRNVFPPDLVDVTIRKGGVMQGLLDKIPDEHIIERGTVLRMDDSSYSVLADDVVRYNPNFRFEEGLTAKTSPGEVFVDGYGDTDSVQQVTMDKKILPEFKKLLEDSALRESDSSAVKLAKRVKVENFIDALTFGMTGDTLEEAREAMTNELFADNSEKLQDLYEKLGDANLKKGEYVELLYDGKNEELQFVEYTKDVEFVSGGRFGPKQATVSNSAPIVSVKI